ncbi:hypothetical protein QZH41_017377 [Actinostola sp. cb2023]|nr:hypothetical protein QZH41_017377 [Actinostola sp. cb2023]
MLVFDDGQKGTINQMQLDSQKGYLYVTTPTKLVRLHLAKCNQHKDRDSCIQAGDPYCGWSSGRCTSWKTKGRNWEQKLDQCPLPKAVWSPWSSWQVCRQQGDNVCQCRKRRCLNTSNSRDCQGEPMELKQCTVDKHGTWSGEAAWLRDGVIHGNWTNWAKWTPCSVTLGSGVRKRYRFCIAPAPSNGGQPCIGNAAQYIECSVNKPLKMAKRRIWTELTGVLGNKNSAMRRMYTCTVLGHDLSNMSLALTKTDYVNCQQDRSRCKIPPTTPPGLWSKWAKWSKCVLIGMQYRARSCKDEDKPCIGDRRQDRQCYPLPSITTETPVTRDTEPTGFIIITLGTVFIIITLGAVFIIITLGAVFIIITLGAVFIIITLGAVFIIITLGAVGRFISVHHHHFRGSLGAVFIIITLGAVFIIITLGAVFIIITLGAVFIIITLGAVFIITLGAVGASLWAVFIIITLGAVFIIITLGAVFIIITLGAVFIIITLGAVFIIITLGAVFIIITLGAVFIIITLGAVFIIITLGAVFIIITLGAVFIIITLGAVFIIITLGAVFIIITLGASSLFIIITLGAVFIIITLGAVFIIITLGAVFIIITLGAVFIIITLGAVFIIITLGAVFIIITFIITLGAVFIIITLGAVFIIITLGAVFIIITLGAVFIIITLGAVFIIITLGAVFIIITLGAVFIIITLGAVFIIITLGAVFIIITLGAVFRGNPDVDTSWSTWSKCLCDLPFKIVPENDSPEPVGIQYRSRSCGQLHVNDGRCPKDRVEYKTCKCEKKDQFTYNKYDGSDVAKERRGYRIGDVIGAAIVTGVLVLVICAVMAYILVRRRQNFEVSKVYKKSMREDPDDSKYERTNGVEYPSESSKDRNSSAKLQPVVVEPKGRKSLKDLFKKSAAPDSV